MLAKIRKSIVYKFILFMLVLVIATVILSSLVLAIFSYAEFKRTTVRDYRNILKSSANEIRLYMQESRNAMETLAFLIAFTRPAPDEWKKDIALTAFAHINPRFMTVALISNEDGRVLTTNPQKKESDYFLTLPYIKALGGDSAISEVKYSGNSLPYVEMAVPIRRLGKVREVLWGELNLKSVWDVLEGIRIGKQGYVSILNADGRYISHREIRPVLRQVTHAELPALSKIRFTEQVIDWVEAESNTFCMATHIGELDWYVLLNQPKSEIYGHIYRSLAWIAAMTAVICLVISFVGWKWVHRLLQPVDDLHRQVKIIGAGDLNQPVRVSAQDEIGALAVAFNQMTASLKETIAAKVEMAQKLERAEHLAVLGEAAGKVTHEIKNLINNNNLILDILKRKPLDDQSQNLIALLQADMKRALAFSKDFMQYAQKPKMKLVPLPPAVLIEETLVAQKEMARRQGVALRFEWAEGLPPVPLDPAHIHRVVTNLVGNSLDALAGAGNQGAITVSGKIAAGVFNLTVADSGPGIRAEIAADIFKPFFSTKGRKGTGLGLAIVKDIVEAHGGRIECHAEPGRGAEFRLYFPLNGALPPA